MAESSTRAAIRPVGGFLAMCFDTVINIFRPPFQWREFFDQIVFLARVSIVPAIMVIVPLCGFVSFTFLLLASQLGAQDLSGAGTGIVVVREIGPIASVLVVAGAGATAICADLGARTIREEIDAMQVLGINPIHRLVVPRVLASGLVAVGINGIACVFGIWIGLMFALKGGSSTGQFFYTLPLLANFNDFYLSELKSLIYGLSAGMVACYRGLTVKGGPKGVGEAVNQTVILSFLLLFLFNALLTALFFKLGVIK
ncbi:MAG TPA: ABC transporter permease [Pseudonocardia sp.]|nr:ABC transporter permease [Pseudonocardia sp.]